MYLNKNTRVINSYPIFFEVNLNFFVKRFVYLKNKLYLRNSNNIVTGFKKYKIMIAFVKTKSNNNNCNGKPLKVLRAGNGYFDLEVPRYGVDETGRPQVEMITATFEMKEISKIEYIRK